MNPFSWLVNLFKEEEVKVVKMEEAVEETVDSILAEFHEKVQKLEDHSRLMAEKVAEEARTIEAAIVRQEQALAQKVRAEFVHSKLAELLGLSNPKE